MSPLADLLRQYWWLVLGVLFVAYELVNAALPWLRAWRRGELAAYREYREWDKKCLEEADQEAKQEAIARVERWMQRRIKEGEKLGLDWATAKKKAAWRLRRLWLRQFFVNFFQMLPLVALIFTPVPLLFAIAHWVYGWAIGSAEVNLLIYLFQAVFSYGPLLILAIVLLTVSGCPLWAGMDISDMMKAEDKNKAKDSEFFFDDYR